MTHRRNTYRVNYLLVSAFIVVVVASFVLAAFLARDLTVTYVENEFASRKVEVLEHNIGPFNDFFHNRIPEISFYQGYLDSAGVAVYADSVFHAYPFVERIVFYDVSLSNDEYIKYGFSADNLVVYPKGVYQFSPEGMAEDVLPVVSRNGHLPLSLSDDFNNMAVKFAAFIERVDTTKALQDDDIFKVFYTVTPGKICYMNIPRRDDLKTYKELMYGKIEHDVVYEQDILTFFIDPNRLSLTNIIPELYQRVQIQPLVYESIDTDPDLLTTETPLPGALADYKIYFSSSRTFLRSEINRRFLPVMAGVIAIYLLLAVIAYLIYRNLYVNERMFKLQYDFINNLTHEFKTPVSVIKIAGNNIQSAKQLSDPERKHYGKILDEEADKLNNLMNTLLSFTQIENKSIKIKQEEVDLHEFCDKVLAASQFKYGDLALHCEVNVKKTLYIDPVLLGSIFQNLIDNAYKYSKRDNKVLDITIKQAKKQVIMRFADKGIGIARRELIHIFKKFYRVQNQYNQQGSVGLGLAFCKELVNFMGGHISVESELGKGTTFTIVFPLD
ncbi:sensor histidine kinase [Parapedobacter indicus]|uniref:histidine kinase n=1 Tax=Parapedobacter indicus TaxID=1477437 RepID=A0A1I3SJ21_9SPHI|nr:HAMP domain-containing sensor histidine kinase [Parapedobacter indicus]PPK99808.1 two-component system phosphate regulon sensor histidine kinase PhoR [Parapedobacter indicus]SFJ58112.1 two-component system, OmpR family, phosphate regulon sensor histidine kinase PhoR [Parapedobacter indicus]